MCGVLAQFLGCAGGGLTFNSGIYFADFASRSTMSLSFSLVLYECFLVKLFFFISHAFVLSQVLSLEIKLREVPREALL